MTDLITQALREAWLNFSQGLALYLPRLIAMLSIVLAGWVIAATVAFVVRWLLALFRFHRLAERTGATQMLRRAGLPAPDHFVGATVFWILWLGFLVSGVGSLGVTGMEQLTAEFVHFVPRILVALVILATGMILANFVWRAMLLAAVNANMPSARLLSTAVRSLVVLLTVAMALEQLGIAKNVVLTAFAIVFGAVMLGIAIAFGIGGGTVARRILEHQFPEKPQSQEDDVSHL